MSSYYCRVIMQSKTVFGYSYNLINLNALNLMFTPCYFVLMSLVAVPYGLGIVSRCLRVDLRRRRVLRKIAAKYRPVFVLSLCPSEKGVIRLYRQRKVIHWLKAMSDERDKMITR